MNNSRSHSFKLCKYDMMIFTWHWKSSYNYWLWIWKTVPVRDFLLLYSLSSLIGIIRTIKMQTDGLVFNTSAQNVSRSSVPQKQWERSWCPTVMNHCHSFHSAHRLRAVSHSTDTERNKTWLLGQMSDWPVHPLQWAGKRRWDESLEKTTHSNLGIEIDLWFNNQQFIAQNSLVPVSKMWICSCFVHLYESKLNMGWVFNSYGTTQSDN